MLFRQSDPGWSLRSPLPVGVQAEGTAWGLGGGAPGAEPCVHPEGGL